MSGQYPHRSGVSCRGLCNGLSKIFREYGNGTILLKHKNLGCWTAWSVDQVEKKDRAVLLMQVGACGY